MVSGGVVEITPAKELDGLPGMVCVFLKAEVD